MLGSCPKYDCDGGFSTTKAVATVWAACMAKQCSTLLRWLLPRGGGEAGIDLSQPVTTQQLPSCWAAAGLICRRTPALVYPGGRCSALSGSLWSSREVCSLPRTMSWCPELLCTTFSRGGELWELVALGGNGVGPQMEKKAKPAARVLLECSTNATTVA